MLDGKELAAHMVTIYNELRVKKELHSPLTRNRLYRLFFLVQLDYFQQSNKFLINNDFVHFKLGPVQLEVYRAYNLYLFDDEIYEPTKEMLFEKGRFSTVNPLLNKPELNTDLKERLVKIFKKFDSFNESELIDYTHHIVKVKERGTLLTEIDYIFAKEKVLM